MVKMYTQLSKTFLDGTNELETKSFEGSDYAEAFSTASSSFFYDMWYATSNSEIKKLVGKIVNENIAVEGNVSIMWERPIPPEEEPGPIDPEIDPVEPEEPIDPEEEPIEG